MVLSREGEKRIKLGTDGWERLEWVECILWGFGLGLRLEGHEEKIKRC